MTCDEQVVIKAVPKYSSSMSYNIKPAHVVDDAVSEIAAMQALQRHHSYGQSVLASRNESRSSSSSSSSSSSRHGS